MSERLYQRHANAFVFVVGCLMVLNCFGANFHTSDHIKDGLLHMAVHYVLHNGALVFLGFLLPPNVLIQSATLFVCLFTYFFYYYVWPVMVEMDRKWQEEEAATRVVGRLPEAEAEAVREATRRAKRLRRAAENARRNQ